MTFGGMNAFEPETPGAFCETTAGGASVLTIRRACIEDVNQVLDLIKALARHHDQEDCVTANANELARSGFGPEPKFGVLLADWDGETAGFVSFTYNYSLWLSSQYMNIDDVFVCEEHRGRKVGEALMLAARTVCTESGLSRMRWEVQADNEDAIRFYERLGARYDEKGVFRWDVTIGE